MWDAFIVCWFSFLPWSAWLTCRVAFFSIDIMAIILAVTKLIFYSYMALPYYHKFVYSLRSYCQPYPHEYLRAVHILKANLWHTWNYLLLREHYSDSKFSFLLFRIQIFYVVLIRPINETAVNRPTSLVLSKHKNSRFPCRACCSLRGYVS